MVPTPRGTCAIASRLIPSPKARVLWDPPASETARPGQPHRVLCTGQNELLPVPSPSLMVGVASGVPSGSQRGEEKLVRSAL